MASSKDFDLAERFASTGIGDGRSSRKENPMTQEIVLKIDEFAASSNKLEIMGWSENRRGYSIISLPCDADAPKIGQRVKVTLEYLEESQ